MLDDEAGRALPACSAPAPGRRAPPAGALDRPASASSPRRPSASLYAPTPSGAYFHVPKRARDDLTRAVRSGTPSCRIDHLPSNQSPSGDEHDVYARSSGGMDDNWSAILSRPSDEAGSCCRDQISAIRHACQAVGTIGIAIRAQSGCRGNCGRYMDRTDAGICDGVVVGIGNRTRDGREAERRNHRSLYPSRASASAPVSSLVFRMPAGERHQHQDRGSEQQHQ